MTDIRYKFHHVGLLCKDATASARFYQEVLGHEIVGRFYQQGVFDFTFLSGGSELLIELIGPPFSEEEWLAIEQRGHALHHLAFAVDDVDAAFADLTSQGLTAVWEPEDFLLLRNAGVLDDNGLVVELLQENEPMQPRKRLDPSQPAPGAFLLHHVDIFSDDWQRTKQFYADHFGLTSVYEYVYGSGGAFIYLADSYFDADERQALIEVIGPPYHEQREFAFAEKHVVGLDHLGYVVADVDAAFEHAKRHGAINFQAPYQDYGTQMCWIQDADNNDLELMKPISKDQLRMAFESKTPYRSLQ